MAFVFPLLYVFPLFKGRSISEGLKCMLCRCKGKATYFYGWFQQDSPSTVLHSLVEKFACLDVKCAYRPADSCWSFLILICFLRTESYEYLWVFSFPLLYFFTCWCRLSRLDNKQSENLGLFWHNFAFLETCCIGISALTLWVVSICTKSDQTCSFVENALWDEHVLQKPNCYQRVLEYTLIWTCRACRCVRIRFHLAKARNWWSAARIGFGLSSTLFFLHFMRVSMHSRCYAVRT